jgi:hypothetical protein
VQTFGCGYVYFVFPCGFLGGDESTTVDASVVGSDGVVDSVTPDPVRLPRVREVKPLADLLPLVRSMLDVVAQCEISSRKVSAMGPPVLGEDFGVVGQTREHVHERVPALPPRKPQGEPGQVRGPRECPHQRVRPGLCYAKRLGEDVDEEHHEPTGPTFEAENTETDVDLLAALRPGLMVGE